MKKKIILLLMLVAFLSLSSCGKSHEHSWDTGKIIKEATCIEKGIKEYSCNGCDEKKQEEIAKKEHVFSTTIIKATCIEDGIEKRTCNNCDFLEEKVLPKTNHVEVIDERIEPTCSKTGLTEGSHCSECKKTIIPQETIAVLPHEYVDGKCINCSMVDVNYDVLPGTTIGLEYQLSDTKDYYIVTGLGTCEEFDLNISSVYKGLPVKEIGNDAFNSCYHLYTIKLPESIIKIGDNAFANCMLLRSIELPNGLLSIGDSAFINCEKLKEIVIPDTVTRISWLAFTGCKNLNSIYIPISVTYIGFDAFQNCSQLTIYCEAPKRPIGWNLSWNSENCKVEWNYKK